MSAEPTDVVIVGAGILGLANAWAASRQGRTVRVIEKSPFAQGASIRNFGMVWPVGQPADRVDLALASRDRWLELVQAGAVEGTRCGSIHLATDDLEATVMREFAASELGARLGATVIDGDEARDRSPAVADSVVAGLWSDAEVGIDSPVAVASLTRWLEAEHDVDFVFGTAAARVEPGLVLTADGTEHRAEIVMGCIGAEPGGPFGEVLLDPGVKRTKLQMLETVPQPDGWRLGPHLASGLTLRHYDSFRVCPSLAELASRIATQTPELDRWGIHVMASQRIDGAVVLGDSHVYGDEIDCFDVAEVDDLIVRELRRIIDLPDWTIRRRWHGVYAKHFEDPVVVRETMPGCHAMVAPGGAGMTLSFGLADRFWDEQR